MKENQANLWTEIVKKLTEMNLTISTMESCTGGGISNEITNISGASSVFREAYVTYSNEAKIKQGVSKDIIEKYTVYSPEVAIEMARAVKQKASSNKISFCCSLFASAICTSCTRVSFLLLIIAYHTTFNLSTGLLGSILPS